MKKLYKAEVNKIIYFMSDDKSCNSDAEYYCKQEEFIESLDLEVVRSMEDITKEWKESLVWGIPGSEDLTVTQAFEKYNK